MGHKVYTFEMLSCGEKKKFLILADQDAVAWGAAAGYVERCSHRVGSITLLDKVDATPELVQQILDQ